MNKYLILLLMIILLSACSRETALTSDIVISEQNNNIFQYKSANNTSADRISAIQQESTIRNIKEEEYLRAKEKYDKTAYEVWECQEYQKNKNLK